MGTRYDSASLMYGDERIVFQRHDRPHNTRSVLIKVHPSCEVEVMAPPHASHDEVLGAVRKRARWIYKQLEEFKDSQEHVLARRYLSGESHYYMGRQHTLKVVDVDRHTPQGVKLLRGKFEVHTRSREVSKIKHLLNAWYKERAEQVFDRRLDAMLDQALWVDDKPEFKTMFMTKQWGNCSPTGALTLNVHLVKAPRECIDYVILHELCHIAEHNHSDRFYSLLSQVLPGWKEVKHRLDRKAHMFMS